MKISKKNSGFSFLETIISVFLISIGMIAVVGLMVNALRESMDSRDQVVATLLSQEGIELVRNLRDNNWVNDRDSFDSSVGFPNSSRSDCRIDSTVSAISCGSGSFVLKLGDEGGDSRYRKLYSYNHGNDTKFQRKLYINYDNDSEKNMAEITSMVAWGDNFPAFNECNSFNKCAYTKTTLGRWGGN